MKIRSSLLFALLSIATLNGCSHSTSPSSSNQNNNPQYGEREFGFATNGTTIDSKNSPSGSTGQVFLMKNLDSATSLVTIELNYFAIVGLTNLQSRSIFIGITANNFGTHSYSIGSYYTADNVASITIDSLSYNSVAGGTVTITKFDTVANLMSGTFSFNATLASGSNSSTTTESITSGFFNDIPITLGAGGQGSITMSAEGLAFTTVVNGQNELTALEIQNLPGISIEGVDDDATWQRVLTMGVQFPKVGTFQFTATPIGQSDAAVAYSTSPIVGTDPSSISITGTTGQLTITKYDTASRRISGTFNFSGFDSLQNKMIQVSNGVIDNVQWSVE